MNSMIFDMETEQDSPGTEVEASALEYNVCNVQAIYPLVVAYGMSFDKVPIRSLGAREGMLSVRVKDRVYSAGYDKRNGVRVVLWTCKKDDGTKWTKVFTQEDFEKFKFFGGETVAGEPEE